MTDEQKAKFKDFEDYETQGKAYNAQFRSNNNNNTSTSSSSQSSSPSVRDLTNLQLSSQNKNFFDIVSGNLQTEIEAISDSIAGSDYSKTISRLSTNKKKIENTTTINSTIAVVISVSFLVGQTIFFPSCLTSLTKFIILDIFISLSTYSKKNN